MRYALMVGCLAAWAATAEAALRTEPVEYRHGETVLEGYLAYDDAAAAPRPGVLVVHEWMGLGPYAKRRAEQLAQLGYVAFAADMYGKGVRAKDHDEAAKLSGVYRNDRQLMRGRILAALEVLQRSDRVDPSRLAAIGYCFGGMTVLELARSGAEIAGVVSVHGGLDTPHTEDAKRITARVLVLHGADDRFVTQDQVAAFEREMQGAGVSYRVIQYPGAVHSFTVREAGDDPSKGMAYNQAADEQSWQAMTGFLFDVLRMSELSHIG
ncbi:MAG: dienelactone hydrolase family protein [Candidatus Omnitrophica bacterium]|nr:dienelactone hydrolase family protein [Candidatus Omnitrophota bacterium]